ncbi:cupin domain-containing protein [Solidesulfovibrio alcoholivorans]|uniref:cupin domain-containing protein n=1 Tax=Solidesulfovibrio alcoholivorans TaxID=81406 RepID=UPI0004969ECD|nr:cupin domain-containing protein [Solidesulfovibrio alcoholivorans]
MKIINVLAEGPFKDKGHGTLWVHDSPNFRIVNFNFRAGQSLPVHSHDVDGELSIVVLEGQGEFLGADDATLPAKAGDVLTCPIATPHGIRAITDMRVLVTIAPPP